jgi:hypothetical protein
MANKRAKGKIYPGSKKGRAMTNDNTATGRSNARQGVRILSSQDSAYVGRPGFKNVGGVPGPVDGKQNVRRLMVRDPAVGRTGPGGDKITSTNVDLVGEQNPKILSGQGINPVTHAGKKTISSGQPTGGPKSPPVKR